MFQFSAIVSATNENVVELPGFSHWTQPRPLYTTHGEMVREVFFYAKNRTQAAKHLGTVGVSGPCGLTSGRNDKSAMVLLTENMRKRILETK